VIAHKGATGVVKMRMDRMEAMGAQMKLISAMVRGKKRFDGSKIAAASEKIADHGRKSGKLFPKGSWKKPTQALPNVWKDWRGFMRSMNTMVRSATVLAEAGRAGNKKRASTAYFALGKSCVACHRNYRFKKKKRR
jgi:cytochrome c556